MTWAIVGHLLIGLIQFVISVVIIAAGIASLNQAQQKAENGLPFTPVMYEGVILLIAGILACVGPHVIIGVNP